MVWRSFEGFVPENITKIVFFDILLNRWETIVSDSSQTEDGKRFWLSRINDVDAKGLSIGLLDSSTDEIIWYTDKTITPSQWALSTNAWGKGRVYNKFRFVISKKNKT